MRELGSSVVVRQMPTTMDLEFVVNFESFTKRKTGLNIARWLIDSHKDVGLLPSYVMHHATDGASNAVLSAQEYEAATRDESETSMTFSTCSAHQVHRAALYACGDRSLVPKRNHELQDALIKLHTIFERIRKSPARAKVLHDVQVENKRYVLFQ